ncbi:MAG TPA: RDD family protein [Candidatus Acidoferrales bacterium]|nr:RDD family protein [Candidatus Acidoferrales bacterium]
MFRAFGEAGKQPDAAAIVEFVAILVGYVVLLIVGQWLDYAWMESSEKQATLGKLALGLVVTNTEGRRISFGRASGRFFAKMITGLIPLGIGYIMAGFTERKQALHHMIASCLVVKK